MRTLIILPLLALFLTGLQSKESIRLDGTITKDEWRGSREQLLNNGCKILLLKKDKAMYVALISPNKIWSHVYLSDGETVKVMHASAALDAVEYKKNNELWLTKDAFQFELRDTVYNNATLAKMEAFYTKNGWVANNGNIGDGKTIEFKINLNLWRNPVYFACVMADYDMNLSYFPLDLNDDTILPKLVQGYTPDSLNFKPNRWEKIK